MKRIYLAGPILFMIVLALPTLSAAQPTIHKGYSPATSGYYTYTNNKTIYFPSSGDPYNGYDTFNYSVNGGVQGPTDGFYVMTTDSNNYKQYFGYDEFVPQTNLTASVIFRPMVLTGTYRFMPLMYYYQKTGLEDFDHWAIGIMWYASTLRLYYNTGNGDSISYTLLSTTSPVASTFYYVTLINNGNSTFVRVYNMDASTVIYNGTTTTPNYDATALYAGFGQYSAGAGNIWGRWDNFTIVGKTNFIVTLPPDAEWALNGGYMLLGAVMIISSTSYAAVKVKNRSGRTDDILIVLLILFVGIGLLIGGVL